MMDDYGGVESRRIDTIRDVRNLFSMTGAQLIRASLMDVDVDAMNEGYKG